MVSRLEYPRLNPKPTLRASSCVLWPLPCIIALSSNPTKGTTLPTEPTTPPSRGSLAAAAAAANQQLHDSGNRTEQYGGAVRDRAPGKGRFDLLSPFFLRSLSQHAEAGAAKYSERNWEKGYSLGLCLDSALRHLNDLQTGDDSEDHAVAAAWNLMAFIHIRALIQKGLLPAHLADDYLPLHLPNPIKETLDAS